MSIPGPFSGVYSAQSRIEGKIKAIKDYTNEISVFYLPEMRHAAKTMLSRNRYLSGIISKHKGNGYLKSIEKNLEDIRSKTDRIVDGYYAKTRLI